MTIKPTKKPSRDRDKFATLPSSSSSSSGGSSSSSSPSEHLHEYYSYHTQQDGAAGPSHSHSSAGVLQRGELGRRHAPYPVENEVPQGHHKKRHSLRTQDRSSPLRVLPQKGIAPVGHRALGSKSPDYGTEPSGYNSDDEHHRVFKGTAMVPSEGADELERKFEEKLKKTNGFVLRKMGEDGACLFRAVADQVYGDQEMHGVVRKLCMDYMAKNADHFSQYVTEDFTNYVARKRRETEHGNHVEMQALAELFNRTIEVYQYSTEPINVFHGAHQTDNPPIRMSYHGGVHYNSVVDPYKATVGVGLGLPQFHPGLADKNLLRDVSRASEVEDIETTMLQDKLKATDWEATDTMLTQQVAQESRLDWLRQQENRRTSPKSKQPSPGSKKPKSLDGNRSPPSAGAGGTHTSPAVQPGPSHAFPVPETASLMNELAPSLFGISDWGDDHDILSQVLAISQQEYLNVLRSHRGNETESGDGPAADKSQADASGKGEHL